MYKPRMQQGWEYAYDFPTKYYPNPFATACVRRKKWMRTRIFNAYNKFVKVNIL